MHVHEFVDEGLGHSSYVIDLLETPHQAIRDGEHVTLAPGVALAAIATPGHTPDHYAYVVAVDGVPVALFTGGSLMVGTVGRTDLCGPELAVPLAHEMFRSLHRFADLPDTVTVYPTHGAGSFCSWLGWLVPAGTPLLFVLDPEQDRDDLVRQCLDVGHEHLVGELEGGIAAWASRDHRVATIPVVGVDQLDGVVIDVSQANEYAAGHLPGARNVELGAIPTARLDAGATVTVMCGHGERAMTAASLLAARGVAARVFDGGPDTWATATGRTLEVGR
jgi:rhodanese-related sulfurtransferase